MRIAFVGKGGAGKTTMAAGFVSYLEQKNAPVLAIDADINRHMGMYLGLKSNVPDLASSFEEVARYLDGERPEFQKLAKIPEMGTIPPAPESRKIFINHEDPFIKRFAVSRGSLSLITAGTYEEEDFGTTCIHVKLKGLELAAHRLADSISDFVVFDATAGVDPLSTSLSFAYDVHILVVEPTSKSLKVFTDYMQVASSIEERVLVVANKVYEQADLDFIKQTVPEDLIIGVVGDSDAMRGFTQGTRPFTHFVEENSGLWETIEKRLMLTRTDRRVSLIRLNEMFEKACLQWANVFYGAELNKILGLDRPSA